MSRGETALFERLAAMTDTMVFITDLEANSLWVNDALVKLTGYTLDDYRFQRFENPFIPAEDVVRVTEFLTAFLGSDEVVSQGFVRNRFVDRWGGTLHVRTRVAKVEWDGAPALLYSTQLESREEAVSDAEERYRSLVEAATDSIVRLRPDLTFHFTNRCFQELVGRTPVQLNAMSFPELVAKEARQTVREALAGDAPRVSVAAPVRRADGETAWLEGTFVRIARGEDTGHLQAILHDTTERRRLDARIQRAQKRETLGEMAGGIAHDLNNILTGILGSATLAEREVAAGSAPAEALSDIRLAAQRAGELSTSMLAYAGEGNAERVTVDFAELVGEMKPLIGTALPKGVELTVDVPSAPIPVAADQVQLRQVVMNLIVNAGDATSDHGGLVEVSAGTFEPAGASPGAQVFGTLPEGPKVAFVRVRDEGGGMSDEVLARIFDPFFSTKGKGRGLGLAAVLGILERHGGCVGVRSRPGVGTSMEVWLPLSDAPIARAAAAPVTRSMAQEACVLVVDDERLLRRLARRALEPLGFEVVEAGSGEAALEVLEERGDAVSVVLLDQTMPGMGGDRALVAIRETFPRLPVIRTSGYAADPQLATEDDFTSFLGKPYGIRQLTDAVASAVASAGAEAAR
ncbi:MAG: ATP-binding protein [Myxococcota bacterium]|nr:ATP-binding protein [Myxococcota bacterium]